MNPSASKRRFVTVDSKESEERTPRSRLLLVLRLLAALPIITLFLYFMSVGTLESRVTYFFAFLLGLLNPIWSLYAIALMGPFYLADLGKTHLLAGLEVFILGIFAGELRMLGRRGPQPLTLGGDELPPALRGPIGIHRRVFWGIWPYYLIGLFFFLIASSLVGWQLWVLQEQQIPGARLHDLMFYGYATLPEWTVRSLWNWGTGMLLACVAARHVTPVRIARWMKFGGAGLVAACLFSLMNYFGWIGLEQLRAPNFDPLHRGRLQGVAGHAGWMGQWIVFMWPGLILWWLGANRPRKILIAAGLALAGVTLLLTAARAPWGAALLTVSAGAVYLHRHHPKGKKFLLIAGAGFLVILFSGLLFGGDALIHRIETLLRVRDRFNYYISGLLFLREHPLGLGLGTHYLFYNWLLTPFFPWFQTDHVTSHSLWLHTLIENGPVFVAFLLLGLGATIMEARRAWAKLTPSQRPIMIALWMGAGGLLIVSLAQYIVYIRIVEISLWAAFGFSVGLCRHYTAGTDEPIPSHWGPRLLLVCGALAIMIATVNVQRNYSGKLPRDYIPNYEEETLSFWTGSEWKTPVPRNIREVQFSILRKTIPGWVTIHWPDGEEETIRFEAGENHAFTWSGPGEETSPFAAHPWLEIHVEPLWTPAKYPGGGDDTRQLGVYVHGFKMKGRAAE